MAVLGECVLGAKVAEALGAVPGDTVISSPESVFDLTGVYPLKMKVVGVLEPSFGADDAAIFVDLRELDGRLAAATGVVADEPLVFSHPVYQYLIARFGLDARSVH